MSEIEKPTPTTEDCRIAWEYLVSRHKWVAADDYYKKNPDKSETRNAYLAGRMDEREAQAQRELGAATPHPRNGKHAPRLRTFGYDRGGDNSRVACRTFAGVRFPAKFGEEYVPLTELEEARAELEEEKRDYESLSKQYLDVQDKLDEKEKELDKAAAIVECKDREISRFRQERYTLNAKLAEKEKELEGAENRMSEWVAGYQKQTAELDEKIALLEKRNYLADKLCDGTFGYGATLARAELAEAKLASQEESLRRMRAALDFYGYEGNFEENIPISFKGDMGNQGHRTSAVNQDRGKRAREAKAAEQADGAISADDNKGEEKV